MPAYLFVGKKPMRYGAHLVSYGDIIHLPAAPNRLFQPLEQNTPLPIILPPETSAGKSELAFESKESKLIDLENREAIAVISELLEYQRTVPAGHTYSLIDSLLLYKTVFSSIREVPYANVILEFGGGMGGSTATICLALRDGGQPATFYSIEQDASRHSAVQRALSHYHLPMVHAELWPANIHSYHAQIASLTLDSLIIDADHYSQEGINWYITYLWPRVRLGGQMFIHDIYKGAPGPETQQVLAAFALYGWEIQSWAGQCILPPAYAPYADKPFTPSPVGLVLHKIR